MYQNMTTLHYHIPATVLRTYNGDFQRWNQKETTGKKNRKLLKQEHWDKYATPAWGKQEFNTQAYMFKNKTNKIPMLNYVTIFPPWCPSDYTK